ncbi:MAG: hypothetical protein SFZ03_06270 [Candidatus Melainabacteria bacterium]|nr:hypothetical protein [Candidatus Melainabacteria bacterium]
MNIPSLCATEALRFAKTSPRQQSDLQTPVVPEDSFVRTFGRGKVLLPVESSPQDLSYEATMALLAKRIGQKRFDDILAGTAAVPSPVRHETDGSWLHRQWIKELNPRVTGGSWFNALKEVLSSTETTLLLKPPYNEGNNCYGAINYDLSHEYLDPVLAEHSQLKTPEAQLKFFTDVCHAMGKTVLLDVTPHMDAFAELFFAKPDLTDWVWLDEARQTERSGPLKQPELAQSQARQLIRQFLRTHGDANGQPVPPDTLERFFDDDMPVEQRIAVLFGTEPRKYPQGQQTPEATQRTEQLLARRIALMNAFVEAGVLPVPVGDAKPFWPPRFSGFKTSPEGVAYAEFQMGDYPPGEKIFGDLAPFRWFRQQESHPEQYEPNRPVWDYFATHLAGVVQQYGFDGIRGDVMWHQPSHGFDTKGPLLHNPDLGAPNIIWRYVKQVIRERNDMPYFATYGEIFGDPSTSYIHPYIHANHCAVDSISSDLHVTSMDDPDFFQKFKSRNMTDYDQYQDNLTRSLGMRPANVVAISDIDHPGDNWRLTNPLEILQRWFLGLHTNNQPMVTTVGLNKRDAHPDPETGFSHFYHRAMPKPYQAGSNALLYNQVQRLERVSTELKPILDHSEHFWLTVNQHQVGAWMYRNRTTHKPELLYLTNTNLKQPAAHIELENPYQAQGQASQSFELLPLLQSEGHSQALLEQQPDGRLRLGDMAPGEYRIYRIRQKLVKSHPHSE